MKQLIKKLLLRSGVYEYFKYSKVFYIYERVFKPHVRRQFEREYNFYNSFLKPCDLIFDIGAYDGHKTDVFLHFTEKVVSCEPDPKNYKTLQIRFRNHKKSVFPENVALGAEVGIQKMFIHHHGSAFNTLNEKFKSVLEADNMQKWNEKIYFQQKHTVNVTTLNELIKKYGRPYFIKIDVEGYEREVLKGISHKIPFISFECLLPDFAEELRESMNLLWKLDRDVHFNIAAHEELLLPEFISFDDMREYLATFNGNHFELIIKMNSNAD
ncbi:MAG: FkbM family methyltransferase [Chitinophagaceae bacterium]